MRASNGVSIFTQLAAMVSQQRELAIGCFFCSLSLFHLVSMFSGSWHLVSMTLDYWEHKIMEYKKEYSCVQYGSTLGLCTLFFIVIKFRESIGKRNARWNFSCSTFVFLSLIRSTMLVMIYALCLGPQICVFSCEVASCRILKSMLIKLERFIW
jgi:hypothetical protein